MCIPRHAAPWNRKSLSLFLRYYCLLGIWHLFSSIYLHNSLANLINNSTILLDTPNTWPMCFGIDPLHMTSFDTINILLVPCWRTSWQQDPSLSSHISKAIVTWLSIVQAKCRQSLLRTVRHLVLFSICTVELLRLGVIPHTYVSAGSLKPTVQRLLMQCSSVWMHCTSVTQSRQCSWLDWVVSVWVAEASSISVVDFSYFLCTSAQPSHSSSVWKISKCGYSCRT